MWINNHNQAIKKMMQLLCSWITPISIPPLLTSSVKVLPVFHGLILSALTSCKYIAHNQSEDPSLPELWPWRMQTPKLDTKRGMSLQVLVRPLLLLWFKSLHPCPKDRMSLGPPQPHPNAAAAAAKSCQSCPTLRDPIDGSLPGSSVHGIFQARTLEWVATAFFQWA